MFVPGYNTLPIAVVSESSSFSTSPPTLGMFCDFHFRSLGGCAVVSRCGFILRSPGD